MSEGPRGTHAGAFPVQGTVGAGGSDSPRKDAGQPCFHCVLSPACPSGSYWADMSPPHCLKCPPHSTAESEGATICTCESDHYRAPGEGAQAACTRESAAGPGHLQGDAGPLPQPCEGRNFPELIICWGLTVRGVIC